MMKTTVHKNIVKKNCSDINQIFLSQDTVKGFLMHIFDCRKLNDKDGKTKWKICREYLIQSRIKYQTLQQNTVPAYR